MRGLTALVAEKQRGIERELAAAADEGVVETLVADADVLRGELAELDDAIAGAPPPDVLDVAGAEAILRAADEAWRTAEAEAARWRAPPTRSTSDSTPPAPQPEASSSPASPASSVRWSTSSRSNPARKRRWRPRSARRSAPSS